MKIYGSKVTINGVEIEGVSEINYAYVEPAQKIEVRPIVFSGTITVIDWESFGGGPCDPMRMCRCANCVNYRRHEIRRSAEYRARFRR